MPNFTIRLIDSKGNPTLTTAGKAHISGQTASYVYAELTPAPLNKRYVFL